MQISVGTDVFSITIHPGPIIVAGRRVASRVDYYARRIEVSDFVSLEARAEVIAHAINQIWLRRCVPVLRVNWAEDPPRQGLRRT